MDAELLLRPADQTPRLLQPVGFRSDWRMRYFAEKLRSHCVLLVLSVFSSLGAGHAA
jgi:hypothetical protein